MVNPSRVVSLILLPFLLAGCANEHAEQAARAQTGLIGLPKQTLLSCAGVPDRTASVVANEYYTYVVQGTSYGFGGPTTSIGIGGGSSSGVGGGIGFGFPLGGGGGVSASCEATFTLRNGAVAALAYTGGPGNPACYPVVRNCLSLVPPPPQR